MPWERLPAPGSTKNHEAKLTGIKIGKLTSRY